MSKEDLLQCVNDIIKNITTLMEKVIEINQSNGSNGSNENCSCKGIIITQGVQTENEVCTIATQTMEEINSFALISDDSDNIEKKFEEEIKPDVETIEPEVTTDKRLALAENLLEGKDYDYLINKRVEYHKQNGTYIEPVKQDKIPIMTPLSKLNKKEQEQLYKDLFTEAVKNVTVYESINKDDPVYKVKIKEEANRLLNVWLETNKFK
jgi:hypothetical protein